MEVETSWHCFWWPLYKLPGQQDLTHTMYTSALVSPDPNLRSGHCETCRNPAAVCEGMGRVWGASHLPDLEHSVIQLLNQQKGNKAVQHFPCRSEGLWKAPGIMWRNLGWHKEKLDVKDLAISCLILLAGQTKTDSTQWEGIWKLKIPHPFSLELDIYLLLQPMSKAGEKVVGSSIARQTLISSPAVLSILAEASACTCENAVFVMCVYVQVYVFAPLHVHTF